MEKQTQFVSGTIRLEGLFEASSGPRGAVLTHPHPLYGGDMYNPAVECLQRAYRKNGFTTLRFNFRGVGKSEGNHEDGVGEKQDVIAAVAFLAGQGIEKIELAGYSFGAWVNALTVTDPARVCRTIMVSPPVAFMDFSKVGAQPALSLVVTGSRDDIAPAEEIRPMLSAWNPDAALEIIEGADHFYWSHLDVLRERLERHIRMNPAP
jgi:alpha/beta superfamily hydrolase